MARTRKPCPGCQKVYNNRPADEVCFECKKLIRIGRERLAEAAAEGVSVTCPSQPHWLPSIYHVYESEVREDFEAAMLKLVQSVQTFEIKEHSWELHQLFPGATASDLRIVLTQAQIDAFREVYAGVKALAQSSYEYGLHEGQSFIVGLASGKVSINKFNNATMGEQD